MNEENTGHTGPHDSNRKEEPPHDENSKEREKRLNSIITFSPGQSIGDWCIIEEIGRGLFGVKVLRKINPFGCTPHIPAVDDFTYRILATLYIAHLIVVYGWSTTFYCYDCCANEHNAHAVHRPCKPTCNGRPSRTPSPDTEGNQSSHLATTAPTLRPSPPRPLPARLRCRSVQRGQGRPITEQLRTSTRTPDRSPTPRHDRDLRICTLNCRTLASNASIAALEQSFEGIRYDVVCLQETKASKTQELTLTNGARLIRGPKVEKKNIGGVGFLIHPRLVSSILSFSILSPRLANKMDKCDGSWPTFNVSTWVRLAIQALYAIKLVHDQGFFHRNISPINFAIGHPSDQERSRLVFLLDFSLSRHYASNINGESKPRLARARAEFRGTARFSSPNVHHEQEQEIRDRTMIAQIKCHLSDEGLMMNMPRELRGVIPSLRQLNCYQRPDYSAIHNALLAVMKRYQVKFDDHYEWEEGTDIRVIKPTTITPWFRAERFLISDPIGITSGPSYV
ncbi:hypothetical protein PRIPAC_85902 [Pristionchus pacificus]|uniref:Endonuclease/exonuclease/phosphatase domain-containing protein n=1 Tax=Pristionchus pacificus TaxID=54126 RepID=A0A2A6BGP1_PRIPA|nr:hypothetical protein PRIPAC_85902 [Pristionchus pacificus]|eukprot:PDM65085.1 hypothetical protein PRIPAC_53334 [Pristionchus pacificus]